MKVSNKIGIQADNDATSMRILQSWLTLHNGLKLDALIGSPIRYLAPWVQLSL